MKSNKSHVYRPKWRSPEADPMEQKIWAVLALFLGGYFYFLYTALSELHR